MYVCVRACREVWLRWHSFQQRYHSPFGLHALHGRLERVSSSLIFRITTQPSSTCDMTVFVDVSELTEVGRVGYEILGIHAREYHHIHIREKKKRT